MIVTSDFILSRRPAFVALEGINGCGKTTLHRLLTAHLTAAGHTVCDTREPGGTPLGLELRKLLLEWRGEPKSHRAELLMFAADRAEHIEKVVKPNLACGKWVITDRFIYSTIAFQGAGRGIERKLIDAANQLAIGETIPDLVILLDLPIKEAFQRIAMRNATSRDNFEDEELAFHARIREGFLTCARESEVPFLVLDAAKTPAELCAEALRACGVSPSTNSALPLK